MQIDIIDKEIEEKENTNNEIRDQINLEKQNIQDL